MGKADDGRAERLAAALRHNLRRRKAQGREIDAVPTEDTGEASGDGVPSRKE